MLNIINGIIIDTFQALREQNNSISFAKANICYICSLERSQFEINGLDYDNHIRVDHSTMSYFHYLIRLNVLNVDELNSIEFYVYNALKDGRKDFFPIKKSLSLSNI